MTRNQTYESFEQRGKDVVSRLKNVESLEPRSERDDIDLRIEANDIWDAFDLDDPMEEPEPEYGDFWPEAPDEEA